VHSCQHKAVVAADATVEVWEAVPPPPPPSPAPTNASAGAAEGNATNSTATSAPTPEAAPPAGDVEGSAGAEAVATAEAPKMRKRQVKVPLAVLGGFDSPGMNRSEIEASRRVMRRLRAADEAKRETARARNDLESYIISTRERVGAQHLLPAYALRWRAGPARPPLRPSTRCRLPERRLPLVSVQPSCACPALAG
jgi:hypothetical protein